MKSIETVELARAYDLTIIALPPHCTHRMQPLDVAFMKPLSSNFSREVQLWLRQYPGQTVSLYDVADLFKKAYQSSIQPSIMTSGFKTCGLWPVDETVFDKYFTNQSAPNDLINLDENPQTSAEQMQPNDSSETNEGEGTATSEDDLNSSTITLPEDMRTVPQVIFTTPKKGKKRKSRAGKTAVITSSPYLKELTLADENKALREELCTMKKEMKKMTKSMRIRNNQNAGPSDVDGEYVDRSEIKVGGSTKKMKQEPKKKKKKSKKNTILNVEENTALNEGAIDEVNDQDTAISNVDHGGSITSIENTITGAIEVGKYVLVEFTGKKDTAKGAFYIGCVAELDTVETKVKTRFLRRADLKKNNQMKFRRLDDQSEEESLTEHTLSQVKLILPDPIALKGTARVSSLLVFEDERLIEYSNEIE